MAIALALARLTIFIVLLCKPVPFAGMISSILFTYSFLSLRVHYYYVYLKRKISPWGYLCLSRQPVKSSFLPGSRPLSFTGYPFSGYFVSLGPGSGYIHYMIPEFMSNLNMLPMKKAQELWQFRLCRDIGCY
jgi:hypothetical protein